MVSREEEPPGSPHSALLGGQLHAVDSALTLSLSAVSPRLQHPYQVCCAYCYFFSSFFKKKTIYTGLKALSKDLERLKNKMFLVLVGQTREVQPAGAHQGVITDSTLVYSQIRQFWKPAGEDAGEDR